MHGVRARTEKFRDLIKRVVVNGRLRHEDLLAALQEAYRMGRHRERQRDYRAQKGAA
jgi:hypothetical protein